MLFGTIKKLLSSEYREFNDTILVESPFRETTRDGKDILRLVQLGLTSRAFIIAYEHDIMGKQTTSRGGSPLCRASSVIEILSMYPWESIKLSVFKKTKKQIVKATFINDGVRYFELIEMPKRNIFWSLWRLNIKELNSSYKKWPFVVISSIKNCNEDVVEKRVPECIELRFIKHTEKEKWATWTDKYLYLGSQREAEDKIRPVPVAGLGRAEEIKLLYLKPRYFGCWEQSEHWVQCGDSSLDVIKENNY
ncbi:hypothetical protein SFRURICE_009710 [Spodoptera frugiperda]|uniref:SFRICE_015521 n=1 Tax=Spodoptera frugiperda TaxID=7108 RepID=A0A2H1WMD3_SPOFR|nr:uncharacterized protein LOC118263626 isoform X1 [Spodoptera frugiperda]KAF9801857.1 hypothetical protein SFRURICE_009710 [Spodoptera frugiperda]